MAQSTEAASAYTAGIVDGEGCISIGRLWRKQTDGHKTLRTYGLWVIVVCRERELTDWLHGRWGGSIGVVNRTKGFAPGTYHRWVVSSRRARDLLAACLPYMTIKAAQARLAIDFQALATRHYRQRDLVGAIGEYEKFYDRLRALKRQRAAATTESSGPAMQVSDSLNHWDGKPVEELPKSTPA